MSETPVRIGGETSGSQMGFITTKQAAQILGITPVRVRQLIQQKTLKSEKQGRDHLLDADDVERFNREGRRTTGRPKKTDPQKVLRTR